MTFQWSFHSCLSLWTNNAKSTISPCVSSGLCIHSSSSGSAYMFAIGLIVPECSLHCLERPAISAIAHPIHEQHEHGFGKITRASCVELEHLRGLQNITLSLLFWWLHRYSHRTDIGEWHPETGQAQKKGKCDSLQPGSALIGGKTEDLFLQWSPFCHFPPIVIFHFSVVICMSV